MEKFSIAYAYDPNGNLVERSLPSGRRVIYEYDAGDRIRAVRYHAGTTVITIAENVTWAPFGPVAGWTFGNGLVESREYDQAYQLSALDSGGKLSRTYGRTAAGRIDEINLLVPEPGGAKGRERTYGYAEGSNRLTSITTTAGDSITLGYDASGNVTGYGDRTLIYDTQGRLREVRRGEERIASYGYDYRNLRRAKAVGSGPATARTFFHYDLAGNLIAERDASGNLLAEYVYLSSDPGAPPLAIVIPGANDSSYVGYYHADHLGTPIRVSDAFGETVWSAGYAAFGRASVDDNPDGDERIVVQNLRFPGQYHDEETGFHYNWYRYYDVSSGRYLQSDPIGLTGGIDLYGYVLNDPLNLIDPDGRIVPQLIGGVVGGGYGYYTGGFQGALVGGAAGVLSTIPIPGINPILGGAVASGVAGFLGNVGLQVVEGTPLGMFGL
jgi:RHS repeat-associated protein